MLKSRRFWLGVIFSAGFLALFFWQVDLGETADALKGANYWWLIPGILAYFIALFFRAVRWRFLLDPMKSIPVRRLFPIISVGYMANNLLPVRLGELVRAFLLGHKEGVNKSSALATIIVERVIDGAFLLILALVVWPFLPVADLLQDFSDKTGIARGLLVLAVSAPFVIVLAVFFLVAASPRLGRRLVRTIVLLIPGRAKGPAAALLSGFLDGLAALRSGRRMLGTLCFTVPIWLAEAAMYYIISLGFSMTVPYQGHLLATSTSNLATSLPSSAGGVGPFEYATRLTVEALGSSVEVAAAFAITLHVALLAPVTLLGLFFLWQENISLGEVARQPGQVLGETTAGEAQQ